MSAIGGIMDVRNYGTDFPSLNKMRLALSLRGRNRSSAFIGGNCCMFFNNSEADAFTYTEDVQPRICERRGRSYALCIDGEGLDTSAVLERYMVSGVEFLGSLDGAFSLSLYDGERDMLILARDKRGKRPLFYRREAGKIYFSSEVKGLLGCMDGYTEINREALAFHLTSTVGVYGASQIYRDVSEVAPGECVLFTHMGMSRFFYREDRSAKRIKTVRDVNNSHKKILEPPADIDPEKLSDYLSEALLAFDMPQFDAYMPSLMELLGSSSQKGRCRVLFEDVLRRKNISYAHEREDRLGNLYGVRAVGVVSKADVEPSRLLYDSLHQRFMSLPEQKHLLLRSVLGRAQYEHIMRSIGIKSTKKEDTEDVIRILGMLCQTVDWAETGRFLIKSEEHGRCFCGA